MDADCHIRTNEPLTPWMNQAELGVWEAKKGVPWETINRQLPRVLWDDYAELEVMIQSNNAQYIYDLKGKVPENMATGQTGDIYDLAEFEWYWWVMFRDKVVSFPESK